MGVGEEVAGWSWRAAALVAAEGDARSGALAAIAEDHLLDVDGGAPVVGDALDAAVGAGALAVPGIEDGADRLSELVGRVIGERL